MSQSQNESGKRPKFSQGANMTSVSTRLRDLRSAAVPRLSVRAMAAALDMPLGTYSNYRSARFKKSTLPLDLTRKIAAVLSGHKVDPAEVMKLAGLSDGEAEPEGRAVERPAPVSSTCLCRSPCLVKVRCAICSIACWLWFPRVHRELKPLKF
jgi:hypothetical protein